MPGVGPFACLLLLLLRTRHATQRIRTAQSPQLTRAESLTRTSPRGTLRVRHPAADHRRSTVNRNPDRINCPDCDTLATVASEYDPAECYTCGGIRTIPNPTIDLRHLRDLIARHGITAELFQSGGGCATIGIGATIPSRDYPECEDYAYNIGVGNYWDGTAHRDELSAGPNDAGWYDPTTPDTYHLNMDTDETADDFARRIVAAYNRYADAGFPTVSAHVLMEAFDAAHTPDPNA